MKKFTLTTTLIALALFALVLAACEGGAAICAGEDCLVEICDNGIDDDNNGFIDCADPACSSSEHCQDPVPGHEDQVPGLTATASCSNGVDDDEDGSIDCDDPDCEEQPVCRNGDPEICTNGVDDDLDGLIDCADPECYDDPACDETPSEDCDNGIDDDGDGEVDCDDSDCFNHSACQGPVEICNNGLDDDEDGLVDNADPACAAGAGSFEQHCSDGVDNDGDGYTDCEDHDCVAADVCRDSHVSGHDYLFAVPGDGIDKVKNVFWGAGVDGSDNAAWWVYATGKVIIGQFARDLNNDLEPEWGVAYSQGTCSPSNIDIHDLSVLQIGAVDSPHEAGSPNIGCFLICMNGTQPNPAFVYNKTNATQMAELAAQVDSYLEVPCAANGLIGYRGMTYIP